MATLEKIRNKSVLLFVIIIVALLAFILGDFLTSGRTYFGSPTTVAKADGVSVDYNDYNNQISELNNQLQSQNRTVNGDAIASQALQNVLTQNLLEREYDRLGITVTDEELNAALLGENATPQAQQMVAYMSQAIGLASPDAAAVFNAMNNPAVYNLSPAQAEQMRSMWADMEKATEQDMRAAKFERLIGGLFTYNKLDAQSLYDDVAATRQVSYAIIDGTSLDADSIDITDAEIQSYYNDRREQFAITEPKRMVDYIYVAIEPSQADKLAADAIVNEAVEALKVTEGTSAVDSNSRFQSTTSRTTAGDIRLPMMRTFITEAEPGDAQLITRTGVEYTLAKLLSVGTGIDSINVTMVQMAPGVDAEAIAAALNAGTEASTFNTDSTRAMESQWSTLEHPDIDAKLHDALASANIGKAFVYTDTIQGQPFQAVYLVNERHAPVPFYEYAVINYVVDPSNETLADLSSNLRTFVSNNSNAADFAENAAEAGYGVLSAEVGPSSVQLGRAADSRRFIKWAMENNVGKVSPVFQDDRQTYLMAVAVKDAYENYRPYTSAAVYDELRLAALNAKKAHILAERYNNAATDLAGYANAFNTEVRSGSVNITNPFLLTFGMGESEIMGAITAAEVGELVGPVEGSRGIVVFTVNDVNTDNRPMVEADYGTQFLRSFSPLRANSPLPLLLGRHKIDNRSLNFVASPVE